MNLEKQTIQVHSEDATKRVDKFLMEKFPEKSRGYLQKLLKEQHVMINKKKAKPSQPLRENDIIEITFPEAVSLELMPKDLKLDIIFEDEDLLVINKPFDVAVHPGNNGAHSEDSIVNGILYHCGKDLPGLNGVQRPGIVHRLDKDTSGILIVAKTERAQKSLSQQFKERTIKKNYITLVEGLVTPSQGTIKAPILRDLYDRKKMAISNAPHAKMAITKFKVLEHHHIQHYPVSLLEIDLLTGRTHQIRVHLRSINHAIVGDPIYGHGKTNDFYKKKYSLRRLFLHAAKVSFAHPQTGETLMFEAPLPAELHNVLMKLNPHR